MDFRRTAERYAALGRPEQLAERIRQFYDAGARHIVLDFVGPYEERPEQIERFARQVLPLLSELA
jgi:alkanesulfonate monooxygenase SsuD/methylene tetrahydromethanopterin reductase-like flavin-dependent oxidoreductase (luciferase family)